MSFSDGELELLEHARAEFDPVIFDRVLLPVDVPVQLPSELISVVLDALHDGVITEDQMDQVMGRIGELAHRDRLKAMIDEGSLPYESVGEQDYVVFEFVTEQ